MGSQGAAARAIKSLKINAPRDERIGAAQSARKHIAGERSNRHGAKAENLAAAKLFLQISVFLT
jgi:hypothetical protein